MTRVFAAAGSAFRALESRNYRLFFFGQMTSVSGTWMQSVGQAWLVLKLTNSGAWLGLLIALQTLPVLIAGAWGGLVADRFDRRRLLVYTQSVSALLALTLGVLTLTGLVRLWMVGVLAVGLGCVNVVDMPARQAFVLELVGKKHLTNAVSLNGVIMNGGRVVGPAAAGVIIATLGIAPCFLLNAASYLAVIAALLLIRRADLHLGQRAPRTAGQLREGFRYVWHEPRLRTPLLMMAVVGMLAYEFTISLPLLARFTFNAGPQGFGLMSSFMAIGAVVGGLVTAARARPSGRRLGIATILFGSMILLASVAPSLAVELLLLSLVGAASIFFAAMANTTLQLAAAPEMRGRVLALYSVAFMGSTPIGGPLIGWIGQAASPRAALAVGGLATLLAAAFAWRTLSRFDRPAPLPLSVLEPAALSRPA